MDAPACLETTVAHCLAAARTLSPEDRLRLAAELLATLPHGYGSRVALGISDDAVSFLATVPAATRRTGLYADDGGYAIDSVDADLGDIQISAQSPDRPLTDAERETLAALPSRTVLPSAMVRAV